MNDNGNWSFKKIAERARSFSLRDLRLTTGLILGIFLLTHFTNHALGLISVSAMESGRYVFGLIWRNPLGTFLLYGSILAHFVLALRALLVRRTLKMPFREAAQLGLGLVLPFMLISHVTGARLDFSLNGQELNYPDVLQNLWVRFPESGLRQSAALVIAWLHGCLGIYFWLRSKQSFSRYAIYLYTGALLVPVLSLLGFAEGGKAIESNLGLYPPVPDIGPGIEPIRNLLYGIFAASIGATFATRALRPYLKGTTRVRIMYPGERAVSIPQGFSVLEGSRLAGIPHQSACGGRGRCSTCRVRILDGLDGQPQASPQERSTLTRIKAGPDIRLACQLRPTHDVSVVPILSANGLGRPSLIGTSRAESARGQERDLAVLFCDLRGFTRLTERRLPFDTVFILNRYFEVVGQAVEQAGGHLDKFIGDGALALFGLNSSADTACRQAYEASLLISEGVRHLNELYTSELDQPLRLAMGLHVGPAIAGEMGYGHAMGLTAVGDSINAASRLEGLAKELDAELVVSEALANLAGLDMSGHERQHVTIRGRRASLDAWIVRQVARH